MVIILPNRLNPARRRYHTKLFFPSELRRWLTASGLTDVEQRFFGFWPKVALEPVSPVVRTAEYLSRVPGMRSLGALIMVSGRKT